ncbi:hypothetical protein THAOC_02063 [Thalassiosira oceanica]|uniref:Uncharacterized protein n=1 Tax=Thalassiosira oceanica TaxID=159749 RepID=K0TFU7_THAOC|nr:hypothetical protein THAOC_02063 [Thalassiosira oceanica]|eukprot:EJK76190.1 hypothetical protein THAOC_02063 [Thalassiosira oceanica]
MRSENDGNKRPRGNEAAHGTVAEADVTDVTSRLAKLESMLRQALGRIGTLEEKNKAMERETRALRKDLKSLQEENQAMRDDMDEVKEDNRARGWSQVKFRRSAVSGLVHGVCDRVCIGIDDDSDEGRMIQHNAALDPHWSVLCQAFYRGINPHGTGISITLKGIQLNGGLMFGICSSLRGRNVREIAFTRIEFINMRAAIQTLRDSLIFSSRVKSLVWSGISIESADDMALFVQMISDRHSVLEKLDFCWNGEGNAQALLAGVDLSKYKRLDFEGNNIQTNGRADIPNLIASNSPLESLDLESNNLNDDDAVQIAESLGRNSNLKELYLDGNNIHQRGRSALLRAIWDTSSMNALSDSNHTCHLGGMSFSLINSRCQWNRAFKILDLMAQRYRSGEGNVPYFKKEMDGEGAVVLAPFIMESVHGRHAAIKERVGKNSSEAQHQGEVGLAREDGHKVWNLSARSLENKTPHQGFWQSMTNA